MTLLQLKYVVTIAEAGTISGAARKLYIAQPSLTAAVKELETELGITLFKRTNKGVLLSPEGQEFLGYARQVMEQTILSRYFQSQQKSPLCLPPSTFRWSLEVTGLTTRSLPMGTLLTLSFRLLTGNSSSARTMRKL